MLNTIGGIASIVSLIGAVISWFFATKSLEHYQNAVKQYAYTDVLSRIKNVAGDIRQNKRKFNGNEKVYERINEKLNGILDDLPPLEEEEKQIEISITMIVKRIDECLNANISIQDLDERQEKIEGRERFKDVDTLYRETINIIKGKIDYMQKNSTNNPVLWLLNKVVKNEKF